MKQVNFLPDITALASLSAVSLSNPPGVRLPADMTPCVVAVADFDILKPGHRRPRQSLTPDTSASSGVGLLCFGKRPSRGRLIDRLLVSADYHGNITRRLALLSRLEAVSQLTFSL